MQIQQITVESKFGIFVGNTRVHVKRHSQTHIKHGGDIHALNDKSHPAELCKSYLKIIDFFLHSHRTSAQLNI